MEHGLQLQHLSPLPLPPEVGPFGVAGHVVDDGGDGGHDPLVGTAAVKVGLCEHHGQHPLVLLLCGRRGRAEKGIGLELILGEPLTQSHHWFVRWLDLFYGQLSPAGVYALWTKPILGELLTQSHHWFVRWLDLFHYFTASCLRQVCILCGQNPSLVNL